MGVAERRQREREERREQILDAAERIFIDTSVESATMDEVAQAAELSKGALYLYFGSKNELVLGVIGRYQEGFLASLAARLESRPTGLASMAMAMRCYADFLDEQPERARIALSHFIGHQQPPADGPRAEFDRHMGFVAQELALVHEAIERGKADGTIRGNVDSSDVSVNMWAGLVGMMIFTLNHSLVACELPHGVAPDMRASVKSFLNLFLRGLAARPEDVEPLLESA